ncbi:hypothetical protein K7X08_032444 [Anisodus acutangulus]|uniref:Uncharacterized protein n=1 Tax=Anisodus acutangulus TaxID=402998 RepID=A0A9Q1RNG7_9SOLA|nr:hypothetical protein K7X08_032444 [Anisodus acutangulus]
MNDCSSICALSRFDALPSPCLTVSAILGHIRRTNSSKDGRSIMKASVQSRSTFSDFKSEIKVYRRSSNCGIQSNIKARCSSSASAPPPQWQQEISIKCANKLISPRSFPLQMLIRVAV